MILPYYKDGNKAEKQPNSKKDIIFRRHLVDRMPIDSWTEVWKKLHSQVVNVDVVNVDTTRAEVYSTVAITVIWSMRFALAIGLYAWIDSVMRPIYTKYIPTDLGVPDKKQPKVLSKTKEALGSIGKSRYVNLFYFQSRLHG